MLELALLATLASPGARTLLGTTPKRRGPYPTELPPAPTLQGGVQARGQCWHRNNWVVTGHDCILTASRKNAQTRQCDEVLSAVLAKLQPPDRTWELYFISPGRTAAEDSYRPLLPLSYSGEPAPYDCSEHVLTDTRGFYRSFASSNQ